MTTENNSNPAFVKAFLPGLILGLVVGALAGAFLPPMLSGGDVIGPMPATTGNSLKTGAPDSRQRELDALSKSEVKPEEGVAPAASPDAEKQPEPKPESATPPAKPEPKPADNQPAEASPK